MARGRCAGCGQEDASAKKIERHINTCPQYLDLWRTDPDRALSPTAEAERWSEVKESDDYDLAKHERRERFLVDVKVKNDKKIEAQTQRWTSREFRNLSGADARSTPVPAPQGGRITERRDDAAGRALMR